MRQVTIASLWALALLGSAVAARSGYLGAAAAAEGLFFALLMGAVLSLSQPSRCGSC